MVIKYPPWSLCTFLPFALIPFPFSRDLWSLISIFCIFYTLRWVIRAGAEKNNTFFAALFFWWIWAAHLSAGQVYLPILVACLSAYEGEKKSPIKNTIMMWAVSSKIFLSTTLFGMWKQLFEKKTLFYTAIVFIISHLILLPKLSQGISGLYVDWIQAATSSATGLGVQVYRGQMNHGFTAGILRYTSWNPQNSAYDIIIWLFLSIFLGLAWNYFSKNLNEKEKWTGWIALGCIVHPLAWHHSFVLAYPLCALTYDAAIKSKKIALISTSIVGISMIALLIPQTIGLKWVTPLELFAMKSWGVCIVAATLCFIRK